MRCVLLVRLSDSTPTPQHPPHPPQSRHPTQGVLEAGKLTPRSLSAFAASGHDAVLARIASLRIREPPPVLLADSSRAWLGDDLRRWR